MLIKIQRILFCEYDSYDYYNFQCVHATERCKDLISCQGNDEID